MVQVLLHTADQKQLRMPENDAKMREKIVINWNLPAAAACAKKADAALLNVEALLWTAVKHKVFETCGHALFLAVCFLL